MNQKSDQCKNCQHTMYGPICSNCGQKKAMPLETKRIVTDMWQQLIDFDFRFIDTFKNLFLNPGFVLNGYIEGQRVSYTNPLKLLFFTATAYFLTIHYLDINIDPVNAQNTGRVVAAFLNYLIFLFLLPTAFLLQMLARRQQLNLAESYMVLGFMWSAYLLLATLGVAILRIQGTWLFAMRSITAVLLFTYCLHGFMKIHWLQAFWRAMVLYLGYILCTMLVMMGIISLSYLVGFEPLMIRLPGQ